MCARHSRFICYFYFARRAPAAACTTHAVRMYTLLLETHVNVRTRASSLSFRRCCASFEGSWPMISSTCRLASTTFDDHSSQCARRASPSIGAHSPSRRSGGAPATAQTHTEQRTAREHGARSTSVSSGRRLASGGAHIRRPTAQYIACVRACIPSSLPRLSCPSRP